MNYYIITGASRGIGAAVAKRMLHPENTLFCIARSENPELQQEAKKLSAAVHFYREDLSRPDPLEGIMKRIFDRIIPEKARTLALINNAGVLEPIKPFNECSAGEIAYGLSLNLVAPAVLSSAFIRLSRDYQVPKKIINISSGAARKPYHGWTCYCTSKAGLDHMTRCMALEQKNVPYPVVIVSFTPGVVDTSMQQAIRRATPEDFPDRERFITLAEEGKLLEPDSVSQVLISILEDESLPQGSFLDIRDMDLRTS